MPERTSPLTVEEAASLIDNAPAPEAQRTDDAGATKAATDDSAAAPVALAAADAPSAEDRPADAPDADAEDDAAAALPSRNPPPHWNAAERELFGKLTPEVQDALLAQEGKRETVVQRVRQESQAARQAAEFERTALNQRVQALDVLLPQALSTFQGRWADIDWTNVTDQLGAEGAFKLRAQFDAEREQLQRLGAIRQQAMSDAHRQFVAAEAEALRTVAPDLADATEGKVRREALGKFLIEEGFPSDRIALMNAKEASIAYDAMRWREAQKRAAAPKTKPALAAPAPRLAPAGVRPSAAAGQRSPQSAADAAMTRLRKTGRIDDAVAYLNARTPQA